MLGSDRLVQQAESLPVEDYNVSDPELYRTDSWRPYFKKLREVAPVHYCRDSLFGPFWSVSTYDLAYKVELNHKVFSSLAKFGGIQLQDIAPNMVQEMIRYQTTGNARFRTVCYLPTKT